MCADLLKNIFTDPYCILKNLRLTKKYQIHEKFGEKLYIFRRFQN